MVSSIINQGKVRFMLYRENMTGPVLIRFMSRLIKDVERKDLSEIRDTGLLEYGRAVYWETRRGMTR